MKRKYAITAKLYCNRCNRFELHNIVFLSVDYLMEIEAVCFKCSHKISGALDFFCPTASIKHLVKLAHSQMKQIIDLERRIRDG